MRIPTLALLVRPRELWPAFTKGSLRWPGPGSGQIQSEGLLELREIRRGGASNDGSCVVSYRIDQETLFAMARSLKNRRPVSRKIGLGGLSVG